MRTSTLTIQQTSLAEIHRHLQYQFDFHYESEGQDMMVLILEEYYFRTNSNQLNMIILKRVGTAVEADIIAGGGGTGFFSISLGAERRFLSKARKFLIELANQSGWPWSETA